YRADNRNAVRLRSCVSVDRVKMYGRKSPRTITDTRPIMNERVVNPISTAELNRRWEAVRRGMKDRKIDALVMQNNNDWLGGYVKWFTDFPAYNGYPRTVIFHAADHMTVVDMGPQGARRKLDGQHDIHRGVGDILCTPSFTSIAYTFG